MTDTLKAKLIARGIKEQDLGKIESLLRALSYHKAEIKSGRFMEDVSEVALESSLHSSAVIALIKKYGETLITGRTISYIKADYQPTGAGAFGHRQPNMTGAGGYFPAYITIEKN